MKIRNIKCVSQDGNSTLYAEIQNHNNLELKFYGHEKIVAPNDVLLLTVFLQSMSEGSDIEFPADCPVSRKLVDNLKSAQFIFSAWYSQLQPIELHVKTSEPLIGQLGVSCLFSAGADAFYTFLQNRDQITHLILCHGLDIQIDEIDRFETTKSNIERVASRYNKKLVVVSTNMRQVFPKFSSNIQHGAILSALSLALGYEKNLVPASHTITDLFPWGSHPLTDPLFSNGTTTIEHHGAIPRSRKIEYIGSFVDALDYLRVCNSENEYNCGNCEKCLRTMFALDALELKASTLPSLKENWQKLKNLKIYNDSKLTFWNDNLELGKRVKKPELIKEAKRICSNYLRRQWVKQGVELVKKN